MTDRLSKEGTEEILQDLYNPKVNLETTRKWHEVHALDQHLNNRNQHYILTAIQHDLVDIHLALDIISRVIETLLKESTS